MGQGGGPASQALLTQVDAASLHPGQQTFEKMISGMYMGELVGREGWQVQVRLVVEDMVEEELMFPGQDTSLLRHMHCMLSSSPMFPRQPGNFPTSFLSEIEADGVSGRAITGPGTR